MRPDVIATDCDALSDLQAARIFEQAEIDRRNFLKLLGTSLALASTACSGPPPEKIIPYARMPENSLPGEPVYYATAFVRDGFAYGVLVENNDGRPIKVEGNPQHCASLGGTDAFAQASIYQLWDPDRSQALRQRGIPAAWNQFHGALRERIGQLTRVKGEGLRILCGPITSPTAIAQLQNVLAQFPRAQLHMHDAIADGNARSGARIAFGRVLDTIYRFENADTIVSFDGDFLTHGPGHIRYARDFSARRQPSAAMCRLYAFESIPNLTGAAADYRMSLAPAEQERLLWRLAQTLGVALPQNLAQEISDTPLPPWWNSMCEELQQRRGTTLIIAGPALPPNAHALAHKLNAVLGNRERSIDYIEPVVPEFLASAPDLQQLVDAMQNNAVDTLLIVDCNATYTAPNSAFTDALARVPCSIHLGLYRDETAQHCTWHIPAAHTFEMWSDARAYDGTANIVQPLITSLYDGKTIHELLALFSGDAAINDRDIVRNYWRGKIPHDFDNVWTDSLRRGFIANTTFPALAVDALPITTTTPPAKLQLQRAPMTLILAPDPCIHDGTHANNAWLQELPKPLTKLTWDHALALSPASARKLGIENGDVVEIRTGATINATLQIPAIVQPQHADNTCSLTLGYGRWCAGHIGNRIGINAYALQSKATPWLRTDITLHKTTLHRDLAFAQRHADMEQRDPVRSIGLEEFLANAQMKNNSVAKNNEQPSLYSPFEKIGYQWGMAIDLNACIGCNACVIACQAENNIPVVGREQVALGRIMHWLRIDRYYDSAADAAALWQPVPCMHCENAPCEEVCPVGATMHDSEGLNVQVYNRCIGTRFCSNNCPYKVRRFNFLQYSETESSSIKARQNPEVTVRQRGVMEKCSYCLQRITRARIEAEKQNRELRDGEVVTACQGACPTRAITFGNIADDTSAVVREKNSSRNYALLEELNTRPRTTYLARVANRTNAQNAGANDGAI